MGVTMFNGGDTEHTHGPWEAVQSQPAKPGLRIVVAVGHSSHCNKGDQCLQLQHLQQSHLSGEPLFF